MRTAADERRALVERVLRRRAALRYIRGLPYLEDVHVPAKLGTFSITTKHEKYLDHEFLVHVGEGAADTIPSVSRDWIDIKYGHRLAYTDAANRAAIEKVIKGFKPQLSRPGVYGDMIMVDLKSAFWQIARRLGYNLMYRPLKTLAGGERMAADDFLWSANKIARGMLVSCALPETTIWQWDGKGKITSQKKFNQLGQPMFVAAVYDVLHGVAADARDLLVYYNVDGGIIHRSHLPLWDEICQSWGLEYGIKASGYALIRTVGSYQIGNLKTMGKNARRKEFDNTKPRNEWLRERFKKFADLKE